MLSDTTDDLVNTIFVESEISSNETITFASFADWYTNVGYTIMPWVELIDMNKWPHQAYNEARKMLYGSDDGSEEEEEQEEEEEEESDTGDTGGGRKKEIFQVQINTEGDMLCVYPHNIDCLLRLQSVTSFHTLSDTDITSIVALVSMHGTGGAVEPLDFVDIVRSFIVNDETNGPEQHFAYSFLNQLYSNFDREKYDVVDGPEIVAGLTILAPGSKSDKLASIFHLYVQPSRLLIRPPVYECNTVGNTFFFFLSLHFGQVR